MESSHWLAAADKLRLGYKQVSLLGWVVGCGEKKADPKKLEGLRKLQPPTSVTEVKSFLGAVGWYRRLIKNFARIAAPLTQLLKKHQEFEWGPNQHAAWETLRAKLMENPVLRLPQEQGRFLLYTD